MLSQLASLRFVLVLLLSARRFPIALASQSFTYNGDAECTFPISNFQITTIRCTESSGTYVQGYNDNNNKYNANNYNQDGVCGFGNTMSVAGTATLGFTAPKKFTVVMQTCYGGTPSWVWYSPMTCKKSRSSLDLTNYALLAEAEYRNEEVDETENYMQVGTYQWRAGFSVPTKGGYFSTGSIVKVTMTLYPVEPYQDFPYYAYGAQPQYTADITDSRYHTTCFASFDAIPDEEQYGNGYYYKAAAGILLFGAATYVTMKRKVICSSCRNGGRDKSPTVVVSDHYKNATDDYDASTIDYNNNADEFDASSINAGSEKL